MKYKILQNDSRVVEGHKVYRIQALHEFKCNLSIIHPGDLGGYVEEENNLSHVGECWIDRNSYVYGGSRVIENSVICEGSIVRDNSYISGDSIIKDSIVRKSSIKNSIVFEETIIEKEIVTTNRRVDIEGVVKIIIGLSEEEKNKLVSRLMEEGFFNEI